MASPYQTATVLLVGTLCVGMLSSTSIALDRQQQAAAVPITRTMDATLPELRAAVDKLLDALDSSTRNSALTD